MAVSEFTFDVEADRRASNRDTDEQRFETSHTGTGMGLTTDTPDQNAARQAEIEHPTPDLDTREEELAYLRRKLGEQGNRLGELQAQAERASALEARLNQLAAQAQAPQSAPMPQSVDIFSGLPADQLFMSPMERERMNTTILALAQATRAEIDRVKDETTYIASRRATGVSDEEEAALLANNPWLGRLNGSDRASALSRLAESRKREASAPGRVADEAARLAARRESFVEPSSRVTGEQTASLEPAQEKLLRDIRGGKTGSHTEIAKALKKLGIGVQDEYGRIT